MSIQAAGFHSAMQSGREALQNNDLTAAVHAYNLAISFAQGPASDAEAYTRRAAAYYKMGEFDCAITDCSAAIKRKPDYPHAYLNRGRAYEQIHEVEHAIADYDRAKNSIPKIRVSVPLGKRHREGWKIEEDN